MNLRTQSKLSMFGYLWLAGCLLAAGYCFVGPELPGESTTPTRDVAFSPSTKLSKPIKDVQLGERVVGENPLAEEVDDSPEPVQATWRKISLKLTKANGKPLWIELLRPQSWIEAERAYFGTKIALDLPEIGATGDAEVLVVENCPAIQRGSGHVVTGKFIHQSAGDLVWLRIEGQPEPTGVTLDHPYWSVDRDDFVAVRDLRLGEELDTEFGPRAVISLQPAAKDETVYNLEIHGQHVYQVGSFAALVHNSYLQTRVSHGYAIIDKNSGEILKFGITSTGKNASGNLLRAQSQLSDLAKARGISRSQLVGVELREFKNRAAARQWEKETVGFWRKNLGHDLEYNIYPKDGIPY